MFRSTLSPKALPWLALIGGVLLLVGLALSLLIHVPSTPPVRKAALAYLSTSGPYPTLWRVNLDGSDAVRLSLPDEKVLDYSPSRDGNQLVYSVGNAQGGTDLWLIDRDGRSRHLLMACGDERCALPAWSPDGKRVLFSRQSAQEPYPRIWLLALDNSQVKPLFDDAAVYGVEALWSPDGRRISVYDPAWQVIRILNLESGQYQSIATPYQTAGSWSADGRLFYYVGGDTAIIPPLGLAYQVDVETGFSLQMFSLGPPDLDYSLPQASPDGSVFLVGRRLYGGSHSVQLWLMNFHGNQEQVISGDFLATRGAYSWDATGERVIFQQLTLGSSRAQPEVILWERATGSLTRIASQAAQPKWLP